MKYSIIIFIILPFNLFATRIPILSPAENYSDADLIFVGNLFEIIDSSYYSKIQSLKFKVKKLSFKIIELLKGECGPTIQINFTLSPFRKTFLFEQKGKYLIFAAKDKQYSDISLKSNYLIQPTPSKIYNDSAETTVALLRKYKDKDILQKDLELTQPSIKVIKNQKLSEMSSDNSNCISKEAVKIRSKASIARTISVNTQSLRYLYNKRLRQNPKLSGTILAVFIIDPYGQVISAKVKRSTMNDKILEDLTIEKIFKWQFSCIEKSNELTEVIYPFKFSQ